MSLESRLTALASRVATEIKAVRTETATLIGPYAADCAATTNPQNFDHGLGLDVEAQVWEGDTQIYPDVTKSATNDGRITVDYGAAPTAGQYRVVVLGRASVVQKFAADSVATTNPQNFDHGLGTDIHVSIWEGASQVFADVTKSSTNGGRVTVDFGSAPTSGQYRVVVMG